MTSALRLLLRLFAYLFGLVLSFFLLGLGIVAWRSGSSLHLGMAPWEGAGLTRALLGMGVAGLASVLLAGSSLRWIFPLWWLFVLVTLVRGFFLSSYWFDGAGGFQFGALLTAGAFLAFLGSLGVFRRRERRR